MSTRDYINRKVMNTYGRTVGRVIGYNSDSKGDLLLLGIELSEGGFKVVPSKHLVHKGDILMLDESWKTIAMNLLQELNIVLRKISALNKLHNAGEISSETFENMGNEYRAIIAALAKQKEVLQDRVEERMKTLRVQVKEVESYFVNLKVSYEIGEVDNEIYRFSKDSFLQSLDQLQLEQKDLDAVKASLSEDSTSQEVKSQPTAQDIPQEPPIVLRIREAGE